MNAPGHLVARVLVAAGAVWVWAPWRAMPPARSLAPGTVRAPQRLAYDPRHAIRVGGSLWSRWTCWSGGALLSLGPMGWRRRVSPVPCHAGPEVSLHPVTARRLGAAVTGGLLAGVISPMLGLAVAGLMWARPVWQARARRRADERDLVEAVPDLVELFRLAIGSGLSVHQAVRALATRLQGPGAEALAEVVAREDRGERLADGLEGMSRRGEPLRPLAVALTAAERYGAPLGPALDRAASDAREVRRRQAEEASRRLPVVLLFPLVLCILPAAALLTVVPLLAASWPHVTG